ncbi:MAG: sensor histidine kinase [Erysipelotrichaceae bacterium]
MKRFGVLRVRITFFISLLLLVVSCVTSYVVIRYANQGFQTIYIGEALSFPSSGFIEGSFGHGLVAGGSEVVLQTTNVFARNIIFFMFAISVLASLATWWITGITLKKIRVLNQEVKQVGLDNFSISSGAFSGDDEVSELATSFQTMLSQLEQSFVAQKQFVSGAAHELKTPLTMMKSSLQLLHMEVEPSKEDFLETTQIIEENTERLIELVQDLLGLATASQLNQQASIALAPLIFEVMDSLASTCQQKQLNIETSLQDIKVCGNVNLIRQAIFNVCENAVKYNSMGGNIAIWLEQDDTDITLSIQDSGIGIVKEDQERIFETFYRGEASRSRDTGGSGIGLALTKQIIEAHHGTISVSVTDQHTCFTIRLPQTK